MRRGARVSLATVLGAVALLATSLLVWRARAPEPSWQSPPAIDLVDDAGRTLTLSELRGRVIVVAFVWTWSEPSRAELAALERIHSDPHERGVSVIAVAEDTGPETVSAARRELGLDYPVLHDAGRVVAARYGPLGLPTTYVFDRRGMQRDRREGFRERDEASIDGELRTLLAE